MIVQVFDLDLTQGGLSPKVLSAIKTYGQKYNHRIWLDFFDADWDAIFPRQKSRGSSRSAAGTRFYRTGTISER